MEKKNKNGSTERRKKTKKSDLYRTLRKHSNRRNFAYRVVAYLPCLRRFLRFPPFFLTVLSNHRHQHCIKQLLSIAGLHFFL